MPEDESKKLVAAFYSLNLTIKLDYCEFGLYIDFETVWLIQGF